ncbi:aminoacyl-tRNA hydrolase [Neomegalonema perideroedes]|uniref:aminoacyl-tRNA hydrolase n=1 Tax=Neomegalonema perideroedes TaxID=217219 RepID=UPI00035E84AD|nr:aminoacyl-tRNA hydrolase [Neomegalonema perideroedes]
MLLLVGLGNPGPEYERTRHNVGFLAVEEIAREAGFGPFGKRFQGLLAEGRLGGEKALILKPLTYMNLSGQSVAEAARFFKIRPGQLVVFHDEIDLAPGKLRVKTGGGHAGHNGLRSIGQHLGLDFHRIRIGVGHPGVKEEVANHVLHAFAKADEVWLGPMLSALGAEAPILVEEDLGKALDKYQQRIMARLQPPKAPKPPKPPEAKPPEAKSAEAKLGAEDAPSPAPQSPLEALRARFSKDAP